MIVLDPKTPENKKNQIKHRSSKAVFTGFYHDFYLNYSRQIHKKMNLPKSPKMSFKCVKNNFLKLSF